MIWAILGMAVVGVVSFVTGLIMGALTVHVAHEHPRPDLRAVPDTDDAA